MAVEPISGSGVSTVIEQVNRLLRDAFGFKGLPSDTTGDNLTERLGLILEMTGQLDGDQGSGEIVDGVPESVAMNNPFRPRRQLRPRARPSEKQIREHHQRILRRL